jgi:hypothetical protein
MNFRSGSVVLPPPVEEGGAYSLDDAVVGVPFTINQPTAPNITNGDHNVTPANWAATLGNGKRLYLSAGSYNGDVTFIENFTDLELVLESGANITGTLYVTGTAARVMVRGENFGDGNINAIFMTSGVADICFKETTIGSGSSGGTKFEGTRIACMSNTIRTGDWCAYSDAGLEHFIFANNDAEGHSAGGGHCVRYIGANQTVTVDNRLYRSGASAYRVHADGFESTDHYLARNQIESSTIFMQADGDANAVYERLIEIWMEDNDYYRNADISSSFAFGSGGERPEILNCTGNRGYGTGSWPSELLPAWDVSGNSVAAYTSTPAWSFR